MKRIISIIFIINISLLLSGHLLAQKENAVISKQNTIKESELSYNIYLLGDIETSPEGVRNLKLLKNELSKENKQSSVILLGDVLKPLGLPDSCDETYNDAKQKIEQILNTFESYNGKLLIIPGNHDWARGKKNALRNRNNEEYFIENYLKKGNVFLPDSGCPGPTEVNLNEDITIIIFDSQWWLNKNREDDRKKCDFEEKEELFIRINDILLRNTDKKVLFVAHHPLYSAGKHGGYFPVSYLLFPLRDINSGLYIPLPGFLYPGYRKHIGNIQDLAHPQYKEFRENLTAIFKQYPNIIYAAGHEHNLQYLNKDSLHHIISGGGGKGDFVAKRKKKADFGFAGSGFCKLSFLKNGDVYMQFITYDDNNAKKIIYEKKLFTKPVYLASNSINSAPVPNYSDSVVYKNISSLYNKGKLHRLLMGDNYRNVWNAEVEFPVFDIGSEKGGLKIIKRGGGMQTHSLRLENKDGKQYVLRSVNKYIEKVLPDYLQNTIAQDAVQDAVSASNPYGALTVPKLADAAGVMHTNPKLFWLPDDPRFDIYRKDFSNNVFLFEERPAGNRSDVASFNHSKKIISTDKVIKKIHKSSKNTIDQEAVVRARLLDILMNDWDRHDDQWRWAKFKEKGKNIYRPIPRDRDQVYFVNEGVLMWLTRRKWIEPKFQDFSYDLKNVESLCYNARHFDRTFMTEPNLDDWLRIARNLQNNLTDSVIHAAISDLPENIYDSIGVEIENKLKSRRNRLDVYAKQYYSFLAKKVDVTGTDKNDFFKIDRLKNGNTIVEIRALSKKKNKKKGLIYKKEFKYDESKEIRIYGLKGNDIFEINGKAKKGSLIRIIGGEGDDKFTDNSHIKGLGKKNLIYDNKTENNTIIKSKETHLMLSKKASVNRYNRKQFKYSKTMPLVSAGYRIDDGVYVGGGFKMKLYNFRDSTIHKFTGDIATQSSSFTVRYDLIYSAVSQHFDFVLNSDAAFLQNENNFYGLGNETLNLTNDKRYYRVRYEYAWANPMLRKTVNYKFNYFAGSFYQYYHVSDTANRYIGEIYPQLLDKEAYAAHHYLGFNAGFKFDTRDDKTRPKRGILWNAQAQNFYDLSNTNKSFLKLTSDLSGYLSFNNNPNLILAFRVGAAANFGDYEFYHSNSLGYKTNLRGFKENRFSGDDYLYQNTDIRVKITDVSNYIFKGQLGLAFFNDIGRIWLEGEDSQKWHDGYGVGAWFLLFDTSVFTLNYNQSEEDRFLNFKFSYMF